MKNILVTGSFGQVGTELVSELVDTYGASSVFATDIKIPDGDHPAHTEILDVTEYDSIVRFLRENSIDAVFHMAAILSALGEKVPDKTFDVNCAGTYNVLRAAREEQIEMVVIPSTIGVFGSETPKENVPSVTLERPSTMYGITKVTAELLSYYFKNTYGLDVRGVRFPGLLSYKTPPSAGTTDYAVDMIREAVAGRAYKCYLSGDAMLPMMYMPDAIDSLIKLSKAESRRLRYTLEYNVQAFSFTPEMLENEIRKHIPEFSVEYRPDYRQKIAETWPRTLDVSDAIEDWGFSPKFTFGQMVEDMIEKMRPNLKYHSN